MTRLIKGHTIGFPSIIYAVLVQYEVCGKFPWVRDVFCRRFRILSLRGGDEAEALAEQSKGTLLIGAASSFFLLSTIGFPNSCVVNYYSNFSPKIKPEAEDL